MDIESMAKMLMTGENGAALKKLAESDEGARLSARFDSKAAEDAVRRGDEAQMKAILQSILKTQEGKKLASRVQEAMNGRGR